jgi:transcriptional regulator with XRE-family HTH domain
MALHPLHTALANLRVRSRWPDQEEFAYQMGLSLGGYRKYETGERIPSQEVMQQIIGKTGISKLAAEALLSMRNEAKAAQVGVSLCQTQAVDCEALAKRVRSEIVYVLKQAGIEVKEGTKGVVEKRIAMILRSVLGV